MTQNRIAVLAAVLFLFAAAGVRAHDDGPSASGEKLGKVKFANSCSPAVQAKLQRGVAMLHSFWYSAAEKTFEEVAGDDASCAIAAWGFASILMSNPLAGRGAQPKDAPRAQAAIDKGREMGAKTQRERDYLEAVAAYYENFDKRSERERQLARAEAYEKLAAKYPKDDEAQIFYALYLGGTQLQSDQTYAAYLKAAGILEKQFRKHPKHPGMAHYLIHNYDAPPIAARGLRAARLYANLAPDAPHALHMPSHIFTRVGAWADAAAANRRSANVAEKSGEPDEALKAAKNVYWSAEVEVMRLSAAAWLAQAQGKGEDALALMRQAADMEDRNEKHIVTPGRVLPARELLGDLLMELKRPADALREYEQSQQREPDRLRGLYGAARAADASGDRVKAARFYRRMAQIARGADGDRPELREMKQYLSAR